MASGNELCIIMSSVGKVQTDKNTPLDLADLDLRINITSKNWVSDDKTIDEILDCNKEFVVFKDVTRIIRRLPIEGEFVTKVCAPLAAYCYSHSADPTGATANCIKTFTVTLTSGYWTFILIYDGITAKSAPIPFNVTAKRLEYILGQMANIGAGNVSVALAGAVYTVTFTNKRQAADIPNGDFTIDYSTGAGGTVVLAQTTAGQQRSHLITQAIERALAYTTFAIAFADEAGSERILFGAVVANLKFAGAEADGKVTFTCDIIARDKQTADGLIIPDCVVYRPIRTTDCLLSYAGVDETDILKGFTTSFDNNVLTGNSAYTGRGINPSRLERAPKRTEQSTWGQLGGVNNQAYLDAESNPEAFITAALALRIGTAGDNLTLNYPNGLATLAANGGIDVDGESEETINRFEVEPMKIGATLPSNIVAHIPQNVGFLDT